MASIDDLDRARVSVRMRYPVLVAEADPTSDAARIGLCADCLHARRIASARGSLFYLCERSASEPKFPRYPQLPVMQCSGYTPKTQTAWRSLNADLDS
jgi:hypothetical protein